MLALAIVKASAKMRTGPPVDAPEDYTLPVWAEEIPLRLMAAAPVPDERCMAQLEVPRNRRSELMIRLPGAWGCRRGNGHARLTNRMGLQRCQ